MEDKDNFKEVIKTTCVCVYPTSAHGPDVIGYWALQADVDLGARYMTLLLIAPCLYRTWTCTLSNALQAINRRGTRLFNENQKGFIRGIDGCLEHSRIAAEILNTHTQPALTYNAKACVQ